MNREIELLAPGGDVDSIKAAIIAGANAIYCGLDKFNARNRAENIVIDDLNGILRLAHEHHCQVFLTLNIIIIESEIPALIRLLNKLVNTGIDGVIVQDLGMLYILARYFPRLNIHASTQLTTHNAGQIKFLSKLSANRVNLCRELSLDEIKSLTQTAHEHQLLTEVFVHGSYCLSFSGLCYFSSVHGGNSGNRGRCSQPCRDQYATTAQGRDFPLNLKDNSAYGDLGPLAETGVDSLKIEGRIKKTHYVYTVVKAWRELLNSDNKQEQIPVDNNDLYTVFNRDFSNGFLQSNIDNNMFIDHPRDHSAIHLAELKGGATEENINSAKKELYDTKTVIINEVRDKIAPLHINKTPLTITITGQPGTSLNVTVKTPEKSFTVQSEGHLVPAKNHQGKPNKQVLDRKPILKRLKAINDTEFFIDGLNIDQLGTGLFIAFKELTNIKKQILLMLMNGVAFLEPVEVPKLQKQPQAETPPTLCLLIASSKDLHLCSESSADIYFQLPNQFKNKSSELLDIFTENRQLLPWFPALLIGENYDAALEFLRQVQPRRIITNNTGIAFAAYQMDIPWIAGPHMNIVNSFSLLCLKEHFNCSGAFLSNEINKGQLRKITRPGDFALYYSIYHPIVLLTSRQCLFQQVTGCEKKRMEDSCLHHCQKSAVTRNLKKKDFFITKTKGNYHSIYNDEHFLNTDIATDLGNDFSHFLIDLRDIKTNTTTTLSKTAIVTLFETHLTGKTDVGTELKQLIHPTTDHQYHQGL